MAAGIQFRGWDEKSKEMVIELSIGVEDATLVPCDWGDEYRADIYLSREMAEEIVKMFEVKYGPSVAVQEGE